MGCNKDYNCFNLYRNVYPSAKYDINHSFKTIFYSNDDIIKVLKQLEIPEDFLGDKIRENLDKIIGDSLDDKNDLEMFQQKTNRFIDDKIEEHKYHYNEWKYMQEEMNGGDTSE